MRLSPLISLTAAAAITPVAGGPLAYAACQTGTLQVPCPSPSLNILQPQPSPALLTIFVTLSLFTDHGCVITTEGCNGLAVACYAAAGFTFGVTIVAAPPAIMACNFGLGTCMATCATVGLLAPTP